MSNPTTSDTAPLDYLAERNRRRRQEWEWARRGRGPRARSLFHIDRIVGWQFFGLVPLKVTVGFVYYFAGREVARWPVPGRLRRRTFFPRQLPTKVHPCRTLRT